MLFGLRLDLPAALLCRIFAVTLHKLQFFLLNCGLAIIHVEESTRARHGGTCSPGRLVRGDGRCADTCRQTALAGALLPSPAAQTSLPLPSILQLSLPDFLRSTFVLAPLWNPHLCPPGFAPLPSEVLNGSIYSSPPPPFSLSPPWRLWPVILSGPDSLLSPW